jgi:hypothetical protein
MATLVTIELPVVVSVEPGRPPFLVTVISPSSNIQLDKKIMNVKSMSLLIDRPFSLILES